MKTSLALRLGALFAMVSAVGCGGKFPLPDEFDAAFVTGSVCMPTDVNTGTEGGAAPPTYPVRFKTCVYRCIAVDRTAPITVNFAWSCAGGQCQMALLAMAHVTRVKTEEDCDARDLPTPDPSECTEQTFDFKLPPPSCSGAGCSQEFLTGDTSVTVPYLTLEQAQEISDRVKKGEALPTVVQQVVGLQNYPARQFVVNFDPSHPVIDDVSALTPADCHSIPAP